MRLRLSLALRTTPLVALALLAPFAARAGAQGAHKALTPDTYDSWRSVERPVLSADGQWAAYTLSPAVGDGEVVLRATTGPREFRFPRGFTGRPILQPNADSGFTPAPVEFTTDGRTMAFLAWAPQAEFARAMRARRGRAGANGAPRASLVIVTTADGKAETIARVKSFRMPKFSGRWIAWLLDAPDSAARNGGRADSAEGGRRRTYGTTLVLRDLASGAESRIEDVTAFAFDDSAAWLGYTVASKTATRDGAYLRALKDGREIALLAGAGDYRNLVFDRAGAQAAFLSNRDDFAAAHPRSSVYYAALAATAKGGPAAAQLVTRSGTFADSLEVSEHGRLAFVRDGGALLFGVGPVQPDTIPADSLIDKAVYDLWNYQDARLQPQQKVALRRDRDRSFTAIWMVKAKAPVLLGNDSLRQVTVSDNGRVALAVNDLQYAVQAMWNEERSDVILLDAATGRRTALAAGVPFGAHLSPGGKYVLWFDGGHWMSYATATGKRADLTGALAGVHFERETWDTPSPAPPWGIAAWTTDDRSVLIYDRADLWEIDPAGVRPARDVTDSLGAKNGLTLRYVDLDPDERALAPNATILLSAFDEHTKADGFYRDQLGAARAPEKIVMDDARFGRPLKARDTDRLLVTRQTFTEFPDLWTGDRLDRLTKISDANPQQREYAWGTDELVSWRSADGIPLQGLLFKPEGFDPAKQYPLIAYFYEQLSDNLHAYVPPAGRNVINPTVYTSKGYLVFMPDIHYDTGYPGPSAVKSIVPGIEALIAKGFVNPKAIGTAGQSWGGYQTAFMITQTHLFAAAFAGAPVANMTSAYGGIRWESGLARAFQYERSQSRIGGSVWEYPRRYLDNSPLFYVDRITTPVLIMSNDGDGAVPWYQGIEFFVALRRFGKEAYLVDYNGDGHNPRKRANQHDIDRKMQQFFDHHLMGAPAPDWMVRGIPALEKGRDQLAPAAPVAGGTAGATPPRTP